MSVIDRLTKHYEEQEKIVIDVPEWKLQIHAYPTTVAEINTIQKISGKNASNLEQAVNLIISKARDSEGKRLFKPTDKESLMERADYNVLARIAEELEKAFFGDLETEKGNLDATTSAETS